jgi:hypothetical protein
MKAQNGGMLGVDRVGDRSSYAILTRNFLGEEAAQRQKRKEPRFGRFIARSPGPLRRSSFLP